MLNVLPLSSQLSGAKREEANKGTGAGFIISSLALRIIFFIEILGRVVSIFPLYPEVISAHLQWQSSSKHSLSEWRLVPVILILSSAAVTVCGIALLPNRLPEESQH